MLTPADVSRLPHLIASLKAVVAEIDAADDPSSPGGVKLTPAEWGGILRRILAVVADIVAIVLL